MAAAGISKEKIEEKFKATYKYRLCWLCRIKPNLDQTHYDDFTTTTTPSTPWAQFLSFIRGGFVIWGGSPSAPTIIINNESDLYNYFEQDDLSDDTSTDPENVTNDIILDVNQQPF